MSPKVNQKGQKRNRKGISLDVKLQRVFEQIEKGMHESSIGKTTLYDLAL